MMDDKQFAAWEALVMTACANHVDIAMVQAMVEVLVRQSAHEISPDAGAPRQDRDGSPCWCNGPWPTEDDHHSWCRTNRQAWRDFLAIITRSSYEIEDEGPTAQRQCTTQREG